MFEVVVCVCNAIRSPAGTSRNEQVRSYRLRSCGSRQFPSFGSQNLPGYPETSAVLFFYACVDTLESCNSRKVGSGSLWTFAVTALKTQSVTRWYTGIKESARSWWIQYDTLQGMDLGCHYIWDYEYTDALGCVKGWNDNYVFLSFSHFAKRYELVTLH